MDYTHHDPYHANSQPHPGIYQPAQFPHFVPPQRLPYDPYYGPQYSSADYADFGPPLHDEYEEGAENLTRPRLTKEQVDVLEAQFQAHPKPNSMVKRQLATQTKLTLPRVANWFQNRRAKAKQQKKQEEFEINQGLGSLQEGWKSETSLPHRPSQNPQNELTDRETRDRSFAETAAAPPALSISSTQQVPKPDNVSQDKGWESLQQTLQQEHAARQHAAQQAHTTMPPPALPRQITTQTLSPATHQDQISAAPVPSFSDWNSGAHSTSWPASQPSIEHANFDFGFDSMEESTSSGSDRNTPTGSHETASSHTIPIEASWPDTLRQPIPIQQPIQLAQLDSSSIHEMAYSTSRRGSTTDLTNNFDTFALAGTTSPPVNHFPEPPQRSDSNESVDLATRRKRPRPAALGSAAIRSRSYGAMSSMSPTLRNNSQIPGPHAVRHVKSTGYNLNARYAGIRKTSSAQRSPMNPPNFAEDESFKRLMAQQTLLERSNEGTSNNTPLMSPELVMQKQIYVPPQHPYHAQGIPASAQFPHSAASYHSTFASPPVTPFRTDYYMASQQQTLMPPVSAGPQYANFPPDCTPPYSAGPLTSSSWSDAPLTSPDLPNFQLMSHMPSMNYSLTHDLATGQYRHFMASPDKAEVSPTLSDQKKTEFFIHEFPGQKEEHAHVAQQLAQQKPKSAAYVFANATPNDY